MDEREWVLPEGWCAVDELGEAERLVVLVHVQCDRLARGVQEWIVALDERVQVMLGVEECARRELQRRPDGLSCVGAGASRPNIESRSGPRRA